MMFRSILWIRQRAHVSATNTVSAIARPLITFDYTRVPQDREPRSGSRDRRLSLRRTEARFHVTQSMASSRRAGQGIPTFWTISSPSSGIASIQSQNIQAAIGRVGAQPVAQSQQLQMNV
jgi:hypothetical protein